MPPADAQEGKFSKIQHGNLDSRRIAVVLRRARRTVEFLLIVEDFLAGVVLLGEVDGCNQISFGVDDLL